MRIVSAAFTLHSSFADLIPRYDGFILDQFGVLHNGRKPLPGAVECVRELLAQKKKLVILSNSSSSSQSCLKKIEKIGFDPLWFESGAVTSGEESIKYIAKRFGSEAIAKKAIWLTYSGGPLTPPPSAFLGQCGSIELASDTKSADFIIAHGSEIWLQQDGREVSLGSFMKDGSLTELAPILESCAENKLPMVCANPDFVVKVADGSTAHMPGK